jgi:hypothetical protein
MTGLTGDPLSIQCFGPVHKAIVFYILLPCKDVVFLEDVAMMKTSKDPWCHPNSLDLGLVRDES